MSTKPIDTVVQSSMTKIRDVATGAVLERFPADVREMVHGVPERYALVTDDTPSIRQTLVAKSLAELQALICGAGVAVSMNDDADDLRARLIPLVESGVVTLS